MITILTDLAADLTQDVLLGTDQRLLKPFFDLRTQFFKTAPQSYFINGLHRSDFERSFLRTGSLNQKMVLVNADQDQILRLISKNLETARKSRSPT